MCFLIYAFCFKLNGRKKITYPAVIFAFLLICMPNLQKHVFWTHPDLPMTACLLCVLYAAKILTYLGKTNSTWFAVPPIKHQIFSHFIHTIIAIFLFSNRHLFEVQNSKIHGLYYISKIMGTGAAVMLPLYFLFNPYMLYAPYKLIDALEYERVSQLTNHYSHGRERRIYRNKITHLSQCY